MRHVRDEQAQRTLSAHQASILDHLDELAPTQVHELASHIGVTPSTMSLHLDKLEAGKYVRRTRDPEDARRVQVRLTKAGVRIKQKQKVLDPDLVAKMLAHLNQEERTAALRGLELLAEGAMRSMKASKS